MKKHFNLKEMGRLDIPTTRSLDRTFLNGPKPFRYTNEERMQYKRDEWFKTI